MLERIDDHLGNNEYPSYLIQNDRGDERTQANHALRFSQKEKHTVSLAASSKREPSAVVDMAVIGAATKNFLFLLVGKQQLLMPATDRLSLPLTRQQPCTAPITILPPSEIRRDGN